MDIFKDILIPVVGGLGIFLLGLEFMEKGIQNLSVNRMRELLARVAGTPVKGVFAGTFITGILQSSTAMTVMVVGLVNSGVMGLRPAISVIMGANIGTTLGNGLIALPLGPLGLFTAGISAVFFCFTKSEKVKNIALAFLGFSLLFYGLSLLTGGLKPLKDLPEVLSLLSSLKADSFGSLLLCVFIAAGITALIHSSSATIGIVMGLGLAGILPWKTAVAFSLGADLGTTITSWMASLNLSRNAKRAAYAHIAFNFIGVGLMVPLFFPAMDALEWGMGLFELSPGKMTVVDGKETFPLVPLAVGVFSIAFNIFNTIALFPFIGVFERILLKVGAKDQADEEDYSLPRFLKRRGKDFSHAATGVHRETLRHLQGSLGFINSALDRNPELNIGKLSSDLDTLNREIRLEASHLLTLQISSQEEEHLPSLISQADFSAGLSETLHQIARRCSREKFGERSKIVLTEVLRDLEARLQFNFPEIFDENSGVMRSDVSLIVARNRILRDDTLSSTEKGSLIAVLGSVERAEWLIIRIAAEHRSVERYLPVSAEEQSAVLA